MKRLNSGERWAIAHVGAFALGCWIAAAVLTIVQYSCQWFTR